jgi:DDE superfamily endonuclease
MLATLLPEPISWDMDLSLICSSVELSAQTQVQPQPQTQVQVQVQVQPQAKSEKKEIKVFTMDESRFGLMTILRRRITIKGVKPIATFQQSFENTYLYGAVTPKTGESFFFEFPYLNTYCFQLFLDEFSLAFTNSLNILVLDNGSFHKAKKLIIPPNIRFIFTPPYTPEVNPIERVWQHFKSILAQDLFLSLDCLSQRLAFLVSSALPIVLSSLTSYPFFSLACNFSP